MSRFEDQEDGVRSAKEEREHRSHIKKIKKHKKKVRKQIIGLVAEMFLLTLLLCGYIGVSKYGEIIDTMHHTEENRTLEPIGSFTPGSSARPTIVVRNSDGETEVVDVTDPDPQESVEPKTAAPGKGYTTYAFFGIDSRGEGHLTSGSQGDVVMIASLNNETKEVSIISVYRDYYLEAKRGEFCKLTDCYAHYGAQATVEALNRNFELNISDYVVVNWLAVADVVDAMGGLDVPMTAKEVTELHNYVYETELAVGRRMTVDPKPIDDTQTLDGIATVCYCRIRKGVGDDYQRTARQRKVVQLMLEKAKTLSFNQISTIIDMLTKEVYITLSGLEVMRLGKDVFKYSITGTSGFPFTHRTMEYIYADNLVDNVKRMHETLYHETDYVPSSYVEYLDVFHQAEIKLYWP